MNQTDYTTMKQEAAKYNERCDCAVKAVALAVGVSYAKAHATLGAFGRKRRQGTKRRSTTLAVQKLAGTRWDGLVHSPRQPNGSKYTPTTIGQAYPTGSHMVFVSGHVFALVEGVAQDWTKGRRHHVKEVWTINPTPINSQAGENTMTIKHTYTAEQLNVKPVKELAAIYNTVAKALDVNLVLRFSTKTAGIKRILKIQEQYKEAHPARKPSAPKKEVKPSTPRKPRKSKGVNTPPKPLEEIKPVLEGSKQHKLAVALLAGATMAELIAVMSESGKPWLESTIKGAFYWDMKSVKGFGVKQEGDRFFLILPEGMDNIPVRNRKSAA